MERYGRDLERQTGQNEDETEDDAERTGFSGKHRCNVCKARIAGKAIDQGHAVKQHAGRQRAKNEILQAGFGRTNAIAVEGGNDVKRERHQLEAEIERDQVIRRNQQHHAKRCQHQQNREFELVELVRTAVDGAHDERHQRTDQRQDLHEAAERIENEGATKGLALRGSEDEPQARHRQNGHGKTGDRRCRPFA